MSSSRETTTEFIKLLTSHQEVIRAFVFSMMPHGKENDDILQNINIKLWERQKTFKKGSNFGAWALTLARYEVLTYRGQAKRLGRLVFDNDLIEKLSDYSESNCQKAKYLSEKRRILHKCLRKLRPVDVELLLIRYSKEKSITQHAEEIGSTAQSLRVTLHRTRKALRDCVDFHLNVDKRANHGS